MTKPSKKTLRTPRIPKYEPPGGKPSRADSPTKEALQGKPETVKTLRDRGEAVPLDPNEKKPPVMETQGRSGKVHPDAIHDKYPPVGANAIPVLTEQK